MNNIYIYIGIYVVLILIASWFFSLSQKKEDFLIAGRKRNGWEIMFSKFATAIGVSYFITYTGFAYEYGVGVFSLLLGLVVGYLFFAYWAAPRIHKNSKKGRFYTIGDFVYSKTRNNFSRHSADVVSMVILFVWLLTGIIGGGKIISDFGFLSYNFAVFLTAFIILAYVLMSGFRAVIMTDIIQGIIIFVLMIFIVLGIIGTNNLEIVLSLQNTGFDLLSSIGFFLFGVLSVFSYADRYQLSYAAKNKNHLKHGIGLSILPVIFIAFLLLLIGNFMSIHAPGLDSGLVFTEALKNFLPASLLPLAIVLFFAGVMGSSDTSIYSISSHYAMSMKKWSVKTIRIVMIFLVVLSFICAIIFPDVVGASIFAGAISLTLAVPMIYLIAGGKKSSKFISSLILGIFGMILGILVLGLNPSAGAFPVIFSALGLLWWK